MISGVTDIPPSSVHRATVAIVKAEAKKELAVAEITSELLGRKLSHRRRRMSSKTRGTSTAVPKQASGRRTKGSYRKLGESAVARLERAWARRGREALARLSAERPVAYVRAMVRLVVVMQHRLPEPPAFDRERARADVLQRVQELARKT